MTVSIIRGTDGGDDLVGTSGNDNFALWQGGSDFVDGGGGNDIFRMGAALNAGDNIDGGTGKDAIVLSGDYSAGLVFNADTIINIEVMALAGGHSYNLTLNDGNVAAGERLLVKGGSLGASDQLTFDGSAETDGKFYFVAGAGDDTLTGGAKHDVFDLTHGGNDTAHGGGGNDTFYLGAAFTAADQRDGGTGDDTLALNGTYNLTLGATTFTHIDTLRLDAGHNYSLTTDDNNVASGDTLTVDFSALTGGSSFTFEGQAESDGNFRFIDGAAGVVYLDGGNGNDVFDLTGAGTGTITLHGNGGDDTVLVGANFNNLAPNTLAGINGGTGNNTLEFNGDYASVTVGSGEGNFGNIVFDGGHSYGAVSIGQLVGASSVTIDASAVTTPFNLTFLNSTSYTIDVGSGGMDTTPTGSGTGNDTFVVTSEAALGASQLNAGNGNNNVLELNGDFATPFTFGATTISSIATIKVDDGYIYNLVANDASLDPGHIMTVDGSALTGSNQLIFDGTAEQDGHFTLRGGASADVLVGGQLNDNITGGGGADTLEGNGNFDIFNYNSVSDSNTASGYDAFVDFSSTTFLHFGNGDMPAYFGSATVSTDLGSLDADLGSVLSGLAADQYAVVTVTNSADPNIDNHVFLVVDPTGGTSGYVGGSDYVIDITGFGGDPAHLNFT